MTVIPLRRGNLAPLSHVPPGHWHGRIWTTDDPVHDGDCYPRCVADFHRTSLWPILIPPDSRFAENGEDWIDDRGFGNPELERAASADPAAILAGWWAENCCAGTCLDPYDAGFPGLARKSSSRADPLVAAAASGSLLSRASMPDGYRLGLVEVDRPADVPAALGWTGMINRTPDVGGLSAVLRSWQDRFGAVLFALGFDSLLLSVAAPPTTASRALALAAEHRAFCLDNFKMQKGDLREFSRGLIRAGHWRFWWD